MTEINKDKEGNLTAANFPTEDTFPTDAVYNKELHIVEQKNVTAIVREDSPETHRRLDREYARNKEFNRTQARATSLSVAVSILNADPNLYNRIKDWAGTDPDVEVEKPHDFFGKSVAPMADRVYDYLTQDQEEL